ncbi:hypothetical protein PAMA_000106 [Pampus argenteus]
MQDSVVKLLCDYLESPHCRLETPRRRSYRTVLSDGVSASYDQLARCLRGPLFNIQSPDGAVSQLQLPHSESVDGDWSWRAIIWTAVGWSVSVGLGLLCCIYVATLHENDLWFSNIKAMELRKRVKASKPEHDLGLSRDAPAEGRCSGYTLRGTATSTAPLEGGSGEVSLLGGSGNCSGSGILSRWPWRQCVSMAAGLLLAGLLALSQAWRWNGRSPFGQSVDCTTLTTSKCCRPRPYRKETGLTCRNCSSVSERGKGGRRKYRAMKGRMDRGEMSKIKDRYGVWEKGRLSDLIHDNLTESKRTINLLQRMNIYQEVFLSVLYRLLPIQFNQFILLVQALIIYTLDCVDFITTTQVTTLYLVQSGLKTGSLLVRLGKLLLHSAMVLLLTVTINYLAKKALQLRSDEHIFKFIKSKFALGATRDFDASLYLCEEAFGLLPLDTLERLAGTLLLYPYALTLLLLSGMLAMAALQNLNGPKAGSVEERKGAGEARVMALRPDVAYNVLHTLFYGLLAFSTMRQQNGWLTARNEEAAPRVTSRSHSFRNSESNKHFSSGKSPMVIIVSCVIMENLTESQRGVNGGRTDWHYGEKPAVTVAARSRLTVQHTKTPKRAVFAGSMQLLAGIKLCTGRVLTNHPHYEDKDLRERTKQIMDGSGENDPDLVPASHPRFCEAVKTDTPAYTALFTVTFQNKTFHVYRVKKKRKKSAKSSSEPSAKSSSEPSAPL